MIGQGALIAVGSELLHHGRRDTNGEELSRMLEARGIATDLRMIVADEIDAVARTDRKSVV